MPSRQRRLSDYQSEGGSSGGGSGGRQQWGERVAAFRAACLKLGVPQEVRRNAVR